MLSKLKNWIINSKGPFTKEGELLDYTEVHVFVNAILYGFKRTTAKDGWEKLKEREDGADEEYTYYHYGYWIGSRLKAVIIGAGAGAGAKGAGLF